MASKSDEWADQAKRLLRAEMVRHGVKNAELARRLTDMGLARNRGVCSGQNQSGSVSGMVPTRGHEGHRRAYPPAARTGIASLCDRFGNFMKRPLPWLLILNIGYVALMIAIIMIATGVLPAQEKACYKGEYSGQKECSSYGLPIAFIVVVGDFLDAHAGSITAIATISIAWFTLTLKRATDRLWSAGNDQLAHAQKQFNAEHRPWMFINNVTLEGGMGFAHTNTSIRINYSLANVGSTPAIDIMMYWRVIANPQQGTIYEEIQALAENYTIVKRSNIANRVPMTVVFPSHSITDARDIDINVSDIAYDFGPTKKLFSPMIILVACYRSPLDKETKFTSSVYSVLIDNAAMVIDDLSAMEPIAPERLSLREWFTGSTAT